MRCSSYLGNIIADRELVPFVPAWIIKEREGYPRTVAASARPLDGERVGRAEKPKRLHLETNIGQQPGAQGAGVQGSRLGRDLNRGSGFMSL